MSKPTKGSGKARQEAEGIDGKKFREGYYAHHGLNEGQPCTKDENDACIRIVKLVLSRKLSEPEGQEKIRQTLYPGVPF